jgi:DNA-binding IclR family transcriptional regulator
MRNELDSGDGGNLRSVSRALRSLELIAEAGELWVTELGRRLGVHKATASRLSPLAEPGFVERVRHRPLPAGVRVDLARRLRHGEPRSRARRSSDTRARPLPRIRADAG